MRSFDRTSSTAAYCSKIFSWSRAGSTFGLSLSDFFPIRSESFVDRLLLSPTAIPIFPIIWAPGTKIPTRSGPSIMSVLVDTCTKSFQRSSFFCSSISLDVFSSSFPVVKAVSTWRKGRYGSAMPVWALHSPIEAISLGSASSSRRINSVTRDDFPAPASPAMKTTWVFQRWLHPEMFLACLVRLHDRQTQNLT